MKKILTAALGAAAVTASLWGAGPASADSATDAFLSDMHAYGFYGTYGDQTLLTRGNMACIRMDAGVPWYAVANEIWLGTSLNGVGAQQFVELSAKSLCPWHFGGDTTGTSQLA